MKKFFKALHASITCVLRKNLSTSKKPEAKVEWITASIINNEEQNSAPNAAFFHRNALAIIDDDIFIRESWELLIDDYQITTFDGPESFLRACAKNPDLWKVFDAYIIDFDFGFKSAVTGAEFASVLREKTDAPLILSSDSDNITAEDLDRFDFRLEKNLWEWRALRSVLTAP